ncbi:MAG: CYTH and CHAD domain-containing protein [Pseudomonadota bacterium]
MKEIELKLLLEPKAIPSLKRRLGAAAGEGRPAKTRQLTTIYLDTGEGALAAAGIALRLRREGRSWTQTVKAGRSMRAGLSETRELNNPAPGGRVDLAAIPDEAMRNMVEEAAAGLPLAPVYETVVKRTTWLIEAGGAEIEVALDRGEVRAGQSAETLDELELELLSGPPSALFALARQMMPTGPLRFSTMNKAARGQRLAAGQAAVPAPEPRFASAVATGGGLSAEAAGREILAECFLQIAENAAAIAATDDPEGPHQLRVGLRRLRSGLQLLRPAFGGPRHTALEAEARWLASEAGRLRDLDVALDDLVRPAAGFAPGETGFQPLAGELARRSEEERRRLRKTLTGARTTAFLFDLSEYVALRGWLDPADHGQTERLAMPFATLAAEALIRADRKARKRAAAAKGGIANLEIEQRHDLRKALKALRYMIEFALPLWPAKRVKPLVKALKSLQTLFGSLNDAAMAEALFLAENAPCASDPAASRAAGRLIGAANAAAEHDWAAAQIRWQDFAAVPRPWA